MKINILQANHGDCIHIRFTDSSRVNRNFLIDGGPSTTYQGKGHSGRIVPGPLKNLIAEIRDNSESVDLLVLSHIDSDHIGGPLKWFENDPDAHKLVKKVLFNSGRLIAEHLSKPEKPDHLVRFRQSKTLQTSVDEGVAFEDFISEKKIWDRRLFRSLDTETVHGVTITVLSPDIASLTKLEKKWRIERPDTFTAAKKDDYDLSIASHLKADKFKEDTTVHNGSSIAFLLTYQKKNVLFLADAHPSIVVDSLTSLGYSPEKKLKAKLVKLAHHGSKGNTNAELLELIDCKDFVVSSNGAVFKLPDKQCLSRIVETVDGVRLHFNYGEMIERIFSKTDRNEFKSFTALPITKAFEI